MVMVGLDGMPPTAVVGTGNFRHLGVWSETMGTDTCTWVVVVVGAGLYKDTIGARPEELTYRIWVYNSEVFHALGLQRQCVVTYCAQMILKNLQGALVVFAYRTT